MILTDLASMILRLAELVFATIVAAVNGQYLHTISDSTTHWQQARFIYTEVVAGLGIFFALIWLIPFSGSFVHWPMDLFISACWFAAFGVLVNVSVPRHHLVTQGASERVGVLGTGQMLTPDSVPQRPQRNLRLYLLLERCDYPR